MAKLTGPLLSIAASGAVAKTQVYASWKGIAYARRWVQPANPQSTEQVETRDTFSWLNRVWKTAPALFVAPWAAAVQGRPLTDRNLFIKQNLSLLRGQADLTGIILSPGAKGGLASTITITPAAGQITIAGADPTPLPSGWSIVGLVGVAIPDQDPQSGSSYTIEADEDLTTAYSVVLTGLAAGDYAAAGWWVYQRSALATDLAYSAAAGTIVTVT